MISNQHGSAIDIFSNREEAGRALDRIVFSGFPIAKVFLVSEDWIDVKGHSYTWMRELVDKARAGEITGTPVELKKGLIMGFAIGGAMGLLLGLIILALPGLEKSILTSAISFILLISVIWAAIGGIIGSLIGIILSTQRSQEIARRVSKGELLLVVEGTDSEITSAKRFVNQVL
ncbi:MAG: hypothetical protein MUD14_16235 [Hydrococcus sp. Prado102]|nr:hypothetical protein [Hydrococcus sp. Prado102]